MIHAIETRYRGCRFRSRLEARWAVFFDTLGLQWEYEPEGFHLHCGPYLPDFFIPEWDAYVEVKGHFERGYEKADACFRLYWLSHDTGKQAVLLVGSPWPGEHEIILEKNSDNVGHWDSFARCPRCQGLCVIVECEACEYGDGFFDWVNLGKHTCTDPVDHFAVKPADRPFVDSALTTAYRAARSARFEHGETPL